jgi:hypothetical protein
MGAEGQGASALPVQQERAAGAQTETTPHQACPSRLGACECEEGSTHQPGHAGPQGRGQGAGHGVAADRRDAGLGKREGGGGDGGWDEEDAHEQAGGAGVHDVEEVQRGGEPRQGPEQGAGGSAERPGASQAPFHFLPHPSVLWWAVLLRPSCF